MGWDGSPDFFATATFRDPTLCPQERLASERRRERMNSIKLGRPKKKRGNKKGSNPKRQIFFACGEVNFFENNGGEGQVLRVVIKLLEVAMY